MDKSQGSHLTQHAKNTGAVRDDPSVKGPMKQHHRLAAGEGVDGVSNPFGQDAPTTKRMVANNEGKNH